MTIVLSIAALCALGIAGPASSALAAQPVTVAGPGPGAGHVELPVGVAVDQSHGFLYVADKNNRRIDKFDLEGNFLMAWGFGVADARSLELQTCGPQASPPTVHCFRREEEGGFTIPNEVGAGAVQPGSVAVQPASGNVYVFDSRARVEEFDPDGHFLRLFGAGVVSGGAAGTGDTEVGSDEIAAVSVSHKAFLTGQPISGAGIPAGAVVKRLFPFAGAIEISKPATATATGVSIASPEGPENVPQNEVQTLAVEAGVTGGIFRLSFAALAPERGTQTTADIPFDATAGEVQSALAALSDIGAGNVEVSGAGGPGGTYTVEFKGSRYADTNVGQLTLARGSNLTGGSVTIATGQDGAAAPEVCVTASACIAGTSGTGPGQISSSSASALAFDPSGDLWVGDTNRLERFDPDGNFQSEIAIPGAGTIRSLAIDSSGDFYVKAQAASMPGIRKLEAGTGNPLAVLDEDGEPEALAVDGAGNVYVGDRTAPYRFFRFDPAGDQTSQFGAGQVVTSSRGEGPEGNALAVDDATRELYVASGQSAENSAVQRFTLPEEGPLPENERVSDLLPTTVTLEADLNPEGHATTYHFEWGEGSSFDQETEPKTLSGSGFDQEPVEPATLAELIPGTEYSFRLSATNHCRVAEPSHDCTVHGEPVTFTMPQAIGIDAQWATDVAAASATLHGRLDPLGVPAEWWIEYGVGGGFELSTPSQPLGGGFGDVSVARTVTGLRPGTTYSFRFAAKDQRDGKGYVVHGSPQTLRTGVAALGFKLPDSRAWEQVTPLVKGGGRITAPFVAGITRASTTGDALTYVTAGAVSDSGEGNRMLDPLQSLARHGPTGWSSEEINPPEQTPVPVTFTSEFRLFSPDLGRAAVEPYGQRANGPSTLSDEASERTPFLRENFADPVRWRPLVTGKEPFANVPPGTRFGGSKPEEQLREYRMPVTVVGASPDLGHLILRSSVPLTEDAAGVGGALYEWSAGALRLVSRLPHGEAVLGALGYWPTGLGVRRRAVSADGRYVYWSNRQDKPTALYVSDMGTGETVRLDVPLLGAVGGEEAPIFQGASADGTRAFFTDTRHLTPDAGETGRDLYVCDLVREAGEDKCDVRDLTPETGGRPAEVQGVVSAIDAAGDDVYFVANGPLAPGAVPGNCTNAQNPSPSANCGLYHAHFDGGDWGVERIATLSNADEPDWGVDLASGRSGDATLSAATSPSGRYFTFMSERSLTGYDNRDAASGEADEEVYRFDAAAPPGKELLCVSCDPSGARPRGKVAREFGPADWHAIWGGGRWLSGLLAGASWASAAPSIATVYQPRRVLDDGRVFFTAFDSLVPADSNATSDAYQYEPHGVGSCTPSSGDAATAQALGGQGCVSILSSGTSERESSVLDASASGDDVFILTASPLSVLDEDPDYDIYDARVGGVAATRQQRTECRGEACQRHGSPPPAQTLASSTFHGPYNTREAERRCGPAGRRAKRLGARARRARRNARRLERRGGAERRVRRLNRKGKHLARKAKRLRSKGRRCHGVTPRGKKDKGSTHRLTLHRHNHRRAR